MPKRKGYAKGFSKMQSRRLPTYKVYRRGAIQKKIFLPGRDRTSGFYGRYVGSHAEKKFFDTDVNDAVVTAAMDIHQLCIIPEGNGESDRIGRKINVKSIHIKGILRMAAATGATSTSDQVICMLIQDTQTNGTEFSAVNLLDTDEFKSFRNLANSQRFVTLFKKVYNIGVSGAAASGAAFVFGEAMRGINVNKYCDIPIEYDNSATSGVITSVRSNNLYWVTQSSDGVCGITANARIRYTDR